MSRTGVVGIGKMHLSQRNRCYQASTPLFDSNWHQKWNSIATKYVVLDRNGYTNMPSVPINGLYFALLSKCLLYTMIGMDTKKDQQMKSFSWHMESPTKEGYRCLIMIPTSPLMNIWDLVAWILWRTASDVIVQNWPPKSTRCNSVIWGPICIPTSPFRHIWN